MDFFKQYYSQEEIDAEIKARLAAYDRVPPELQHLICGDDSEIVAGIKAAMPLGPPVFTLAKPLTPTEEMRIDNEITSNAHIMRIFGDRAASDATGIRAIDEMVEKQKRDDFEKLLGQGKRTASALDEMIRKAVEDVLVKGSRVPARESEREPLRILDHDHDSDSLITLHKRTHPNCKRCAAAGAAA
jgi:hypothetical protein